MGKSTFGARVCRGGYTLALFFTPLFILQAPANAAEDSASIRGMVIDAASGQGLRKAYIRLSPVGRSTPAPYAAVTNDRGVFTIDDLPPGAYRLDVECVGFMDARYGGGSPENPSAELRLSAGDHLDGIEVKMTRHAVLSGRIVDQDGDPWPHANLSVFHSAWRHGRKGIEPADSSNVLGVDDRGEFRIAGLAPGRYYIQAEPDAAWEREHHSDVKGQPTARHQPTWYPSSPDLASSMPVTLSAGQQLGGVEIRLRRGAADFRIRGQAKGMRDIPLPKGDPRLVQPRIFALQTSAALGTEQEVYGHISPDGSFEIRGAAPGTYEVWITEGFPDRSPLGHTTVVVDDLDVDDISIELHPPQTLQVAVHIEGADGKLAPVPIYLEPHEVMPFVEPFPTTKEDGSLEFQNLGQARYQVRLQPPAREQMFLKTLRYGNSESRDGTFVLTSDGTPLQLVFSTRCARLSGSLLPATSVTPRVVLIPDAPDAVRREYETRIAVFDQSGVFRIQCVPPGSYTVYAFEEVPDGVWLGPEFIREIESSGVSFKAAEGEGSTIQLPLLRKAETDRALTKLGSE